MTEGNLYLSDEGVANRRALPPAAQDILHVSCSWETHQAQTWDFMVHGSSLGALSSQPVLAAGTPADRVGTVAGPAAGEKAGPVHGPAWPQ